MSEDNVTFIQFNPAEDLPVDRILKEVNATKFQNLVVAGFKDDGNTFVYWATAADDGKTLMLLEIAKRQLLEACLGE